MRPSAERVSYCALMTCTSMLLSYLEAFLPSVPIPCFKLGLANVIIMLVFLTYGFKEAFAVSVCRILLSSLLFGSPVSFLFSFCGGALSLCALGLYGKFLRRYTGAIGLGIICAMLHNIGQCLAAALIYGVSVLLTYLPWLILLSVPTGALTGTVLYILSVRLNKL